MNLKKPLFIDALFHAESDRELRELGIVEDAGCDNTPLEVCILSISSIRPYGSSGEELLKTIIGVGGDTYLIDNEYSEVIEYLTEKGYI